MTAALSIDRLHKTFADKVAVNQLSLDVPAGQFFALLGHNGAGKTTTLKMIAGLTKPDQGSIKLFGHDIEQDAAAAKTLLAYLPDEPLLYGRLRPLEYLEFVSGLWGIDARTAESRARELLEWTNLWAHRGETCDGFSRGMQQKLALCGALIHDPKLLMLDEPLTGLDVMAAREVKELLQAKVKEGCTVILTTHILDVAERLAEDIALIKAGSLIARGSLEQLREQSGKVGGSLEDVFVELTQAEAA
ncbi:ABC transporter ATP-binding protein [Burkholderiaceae bacterium DAT-1]|nr:ABC transporter ATP-binding protein [Burkholderiaceae bacterium DAT-1]